MRLRRCALFIRGKETDHGGRKQGNRSGTASAAANRVEGPQDPGPADFHGTGGASAGERDFAQARFRRKAAGDLQHARRRVDWRRRGFDGDLLRKAGPGNSRGGGERQLSEGGRGAVSVCDGRGGIRGEIYGGPCGRIRRGPGEDGRDGPQRRGADCRGGGHEAEGRGHTSGLSGADLSLHGHAAPAGTV